MCEFVILIIVVAIIISLAKSFISYIANASAHNKKVPDWLDRYNGKK